MNLSMGASLLAVAKYIYISLYTMMAKPIRALEMHYPMIQFLILPVMWSG